MKNFFLLLLAFCAIALATVSCSKKDTADMAPTAKTVAQNSTNPYDYVGVQHNQGLDYYLAKADFNVAADEVEPKTLDFLQEAGYSRSAMQEVLNQPYVNEIIHSADPVEALRQYYTTNGNTKELDYLDRMVDAMSTSTNSDQAVSRLTQIEDDVQADNSLTASSQESLLKGLAVGRHSAQYWYEQQAQGDQSTWLQANAGTIGATNQPGGPNSLRPWWHYGLADLAGTLGGTIAGGIGASIIFWLGDHKD
ncbi:hypothetical protein [Hymenobacter negativus]|uniref:Uncharacterized protein n=1 Tax=Hymenobacter negativus TaxID=2795026 RepID=A0ABS0Q655_9BACT|nr:MULTISPECIES: hypothetical protein [Bacteria]MBH8557741.1 hypothetical protein [Hymenobacter negativus]MBH8567733.1 hypothetical protein [Hymenobacter negativus]MBR7207467.1 hypothetical protein [Microvirga sp. STS02]